jgi:hypothetical protein
VFKVVDLAQTLAAVLILRLNFNPAHCAMVDDECVSFHNRASVDYAI